jgi:hypothetical protein
MKTSMKFAALIIALLLSSTASTAQSTKDTLSTKRPILVAYKSEAGLFINLPTAERLVKINTYNRFLILDREDCYQDLQSTMIQLESVTNTLKMTEVELNEVRLSLDNASDNVRVLADDFKKEVKGNVWEKIGKTSIRVVQFAAVGSLGYLIGTSK